MRCYNEDFLVLSPEVNLRCAVYGTLYKTQELTKSFFFFNLNWLTSSSVREVECWEYFPWQVPLRLTGKLGHKYNYEETVLRACFSLCVRSLIRSPGCFLRGIAGGLKSPRRLGQREIIPGVALSPPEWLLHRCESFQYFSSLIVEGTQSPLDCAHEPRESRRAEVGNRTGIRQLTSLTTP